MAEPTLDDVVLELKNLVKEVQVGNLIATATNKIVSASFAGVSPAAGHKPPPVPSASPSPASPGGLPPAPVPPSGRAATPPPLPAPIPPPRPSTPSPLPVPPINWMTALMAKAAVAPTPAPAPLTPTTPPPTPATKPPRTFLGRVRRGIVRGLGHKFRQSRIGRAASSAQQRVGRFLGGKGASGIKGLSGGSLAAARLAGPIGAVIAVGEALNEFRKAVIHATDVQIANARRLAEVHGGIAVTFARREVTEIRRDILRGDATTGSTRQLVEAEQRRKDATLPLETAIDNATNRVLAKLNDALTEFATLANQGLELIKKIPGVAGLLEAEGAGGDADIPRALGDLAVGEAQRRDAAGRDLMDIARETAARVGAARGDPIAVRPRGAP